MNNSIQELLRCTENNNEKIKKINFLNDNFIQLFHFLLDTQKNIYNEENNIDKYQCTIETEKQEKQDKLKDIK